MSLHFLILSISVEFVSWLVYVWITISGILFFSFKQKTEYEMRIRDWSEDVCSSDLDAANKAANADLALQELGADYAGQAYVTATITVWDKDPNIASKKLRLVEKVIQGRDFTAMPETVNAVDAWLGGLPGHVYANVLQPPVSTHNPAHTIPLAAVWAGPERDEHLGEPPLAFGRNEGSTPFR